MVGSLQDIHTIGQDATYKVLVCAVPVIVTGVIDAKNHFHIKVISIGNGEKQADFQL